MLAPNCWRVSGGVGLFFAPDPTHLGVVEYLIAHPTILNGLLAILQPDVLFVLFYDSKGL